MPASSVGLRCGRRILFFCTVRVRPLPCLGACCAEWWRGEGGTVSGTGSRRLGAVDEVGGGGVLAREMLVGVG